MKVKCEVQRMVWLSRRQPNREGRRHFADSGFPACPAERISRAPEKNTWVSYKSYNTIERAVLITLKAFGLPDVWKRLQEHLHLHLHLSHHFSLGGSSIIIFTEESRAKARLLTETSPCHIYVHLEVASFRLPVESKLLTPRQTRPTYPWPP